MLPLSKFAEVVSRRHRINCQVDFDKVIVFGPLSRQNIMHMSINIAFLLHTVYNEFYNIVGEFYTAFF